MPWFVIRSGPPDAPRIFVQRPAYSTRAAAEAAAWDDSQLINGHLGPVDQSVPPYIFEAADLNGALLQYSRQLAPPPTRRED